MKLYLRPSGGTPGITPTPSTEWEFSTGFSRVVPSETKTNTAFANKAATDPTATANRDSLLYQFIHPLPTGTVFSTADTFIGQIMAFEGALASNLRTMVVARVIASNGSTVRATLYAGDMTTLTGNPTSEWHTSARNIHAPRGVGGVQLASAYTTVAGDYLVIEIGYRKHAAASTTGTIRLGDTNASSDLPANETQTTDGATWMEIVQAAAGDTIATDDFTDADDVTLTAHNASWTQLGGTQAVIKSNRLARISGAVGPVYRHGTAPTSAEYDISLVVARPGSGPANGVAISGRCSGVQGSRNGYEAWVYEGNTVVELYRMDAGTYVLLGSASPGGITVGNTGTLTLRIRDKVKQALWNGVVVVSSRDSTYASAGSVDIAFDDTQSAAAAGYHMDSVLAKDVLATTPVPKSGNDTQNISQSESASAAVAAPASDSQGLSSSDSASVAETAQKGGSDSQALTTTDAAGVGAQIQGADSNAISASETRSIAATLSRADSQAIASSEAVISSASATVVDTQGVQSSENASVAATEPKSAPDTQAVSAAETALAQVSQTRTDSQGLGSSDLASPEGRIPAADAQSLGSSDGVSLAAIEPRSGDDAQGLQGSDQASLAVAVARADAQGLASAEVASVAASRSLSDSQGLAASDEVALLQIVPQSGVDVQTLDTADTAAPLATQTRDDAQVLSTSDFTSINKGGEPVDVTDAQAIAGQDEISLTVRITLTDSQHMIGTDHTYYEPYLGTQEKAPVDATFLQTVEAASVLVYILADDMARIAAIEKAVIIDSAVPGGPPMVGAPGVPTVPGGAAGSTHVLGRSGVLGAMGVGYSGNVKARSNS